MGLDVEEGLVQEGLPSAGETWVLVEKGCRLGWDGGSGGNRRESRCEEPQQAGGGKLVWVCVGRTLRTWNFSFCQTKGDVCCKL